MRWLRFMLGFTCRKTAFFWIPAPVFTGVTFFRGNDGAVWAVLISRFSPVSLKIAEARFSEPIQKTIVQTRARCYNTRSQFLRSVYRCLSR